MIKIKKSTQRLNAPIASKLDCESAIYTNKRREGRTLLFFN